MKFFCFHSDREGSGPLRERLVEEHWSYMDAYEGRLSVRGPAFDEHGELAGSVHVVDLDGPAEARAFAFDEPSYQAGAYRDVLLRRWRDALGRSMWDYPRREDTEGLYLCVGFEPEPRPPAQDPAPDADLVAYGHLLSDDGSLQLGTVAIVRAPGSHAAEALLAQRSHIGIETYGWTFGGRR